MNACHLSATAGHSELVNMLLSNGASLSVLLPSGELYHCTEFHGVQHLLDTHQQTHTRLVFDSIADKKGLARLKSTFLVRFFLIFFTHILVLLLIFFLLVFVRPQFASVTTDRLYLN